MMQGLKGFLKELGYRVAGAVIAVGGIVLLAMAGDYFNIGFLQSSGGLLVTLIIVGELLFFTVLGYAAATGKL